MNSAPVITWFEIPSVNFDRAVKFYETVLKVSLKREEMDAIAMAVFPHDEVQSGGAVVNGANYKPGADGVCVYLFSADFDAALQRVEQNGGKIVLPKMSIGPNGHIAHFIDCEGNRIGLHTLP